MRTMLVVLAASISFAGGAFVGAAGKSNAYAAVTAVLTNPVDYTSSQWRSVCVFNKDAAGNYSGEIIWEPTDTGNGQKSVALSSRRSTGTLPVAYQNFVNAWIGFARTDFPAFN